MTTQTLTRKKRTDRNHIIYELRINGANYIGVTAKTETTINKSVLARAAKHYYRAKTESKNWNMTLGQITFACRTFMPQKQPYEL